MPSSEKQLHTQTFTNGINTSTAPELLGADTARYMLNCYTLATGQGNVGVVTNIKGNTIVSDTLPLGDNKCIGVVTDDENNKFYFFVWNSEGYHSIRMYDEVSNSIIKIVESITDTGGSDVLNFSKDYLVLMGDVVRDKLLYWVDGLNDARKINVEKALDPTTSGYGGTITADFINAYKFAPTFAPTTDYFSDTTKNFNYLYGRIRKFAYRYKYDDGEYSTYSSWSNPAIPLYENFNGVNSIPTDNNGLNITVNTGNMLVRQIEIVMFAPTDENPNPDWLTIAVIDKEDKGLGDFSNYIYKFYNDGSYPVASAQKIIQPYSYLPAVPRCQAVAGGSIIYSNFKEGFEDVDIDATAEITYEDLFIDEGTEERLSTASILVSQIPAQTDYMSTGVWTNLDGTRGYRQGTTLANAHEVTIGSDVNEGNHYFINMSRGTDYFTVDYKATVTDTAVTVAAQLKQKLIATTQIILRPNDQSRTPYNIYDNTIDSFGNVTFRFWIIRISNKQSKGNYYNSSGSVTQVQTVSLKDTGQSVPNMKLGAGTKYGIVYYDKDGRNSLVYTDDILNTTTKTENALGGIKAPVVTLTVNHLPPLWAVYWEVVRTKDLTFNTFIDMLIQEVIEVPATTQNGEYLDLVVGSLFTYQRIHPNTTLKYEFKKGDRIRFKQKPDKTYYPDFETEILSYKDVTEEDIESNIVINGTNTVTVGAASIENIGRYIQVDGYERQIVDAPSGTTYLVNQVIGNSSSPQTFLGYKLIDRRGLLRIRKPNVSSGVDLSNGNRSTVEIFTPSTSGADLGSRQFFHYNKKFNIINAGLPNRYHSGDVQNQSNSQPAKVRVNAGTVYVRNRELPTTNSIKNAQVVIRVIEDPAYSDFYYSTMNANGRTNVEDTKQGVVHFGDRMRFSATQIEDTSILGFNDFENLNRKDYNDKYGDIVLTIATENQILVFKVLKDCIVPVFQNVIQDAAGQEVLGVSRTLLNDIRYYSHDGGIGKNPESYCRNENNHYHVSPNSGCWIRLGGDGATPISEVYFFDNEARRLLSEASKNGAYIFGGFDPLLSQAIWSIEGFVTKTLSTGFNTGTFEILSPELPEGTIQSITTPPTNGTLSDIDSNNRVIYTPNAGFTGSDSFQYSTIVNGQTVIKKACISVVPLAVVAAWRPKLDSGSCVIEEGVTTGFLAYSTLEQFNQLNGVATGVEKPNIPSDPDYVLPVYSPATCISAQWVIDEDFIYCEQSTPEDIFYIWGRLELEDTEQIDTDVFIADVYFKTYKGSSSTVPPDFIEDNLYPITKENIECRMGGFDGFNPIIQVNFNVDLANDDTLKITPLNSGIDTYGSSGKYFVSNLSTLSSRNFNVLNPDYIIGLGLGTGDQVKVLETIIE